MRAINGGSKCSTKQEALPWSCQQASKEQQTLFFLEMLFVTGPFRGREVDTWHKLTSLFWMSGTHLFTPSSRLDLLEHESMSVEKKKKATTQ